MEEGGSGRVEDELQARREERTREVAADPAAAPLETRKEVSKGSWRRVGGGGGRRCWRCPWLRQLCRVVGGGA